MGKAGCVDHAENRRLQMLPPMFWPKQPRFLNLEPVALPEEPVQGAAAQGVTITTTADLTPEFIGAIVTLAPESLRKLLTPEMVLALSPEQLAVLPEEFIASLDEGTQAALLARAESSAETPGQLNRSRCRKNWSPALRAGGRLTITTTDLTLKCWAALRKWYLNHCNC